MTAAKLFWSIRGVTVCLIAAMFLLGVNDSSDSTTLLAIVLVTLGIPHGAADHLIFESRSSNYRTGRFMAFYGILILIYGLLWYLLPLVALLLFLISSIYHFGQSYRQEKSGSHVVALSRQIAWGGFVLMFPVVYHYAQAAPIITRMLGFGVDVPDYLQILLPTTLVSINGLMNWMDYTRGSISRSAFTTRSIDLLLLTILYLQADLLLGFAAFFLLWHSLPAGREQWHYLRRHHLTPTFRHYLVQLLPLSLGALLTMALAYWYMGRDGSGAADLGLLFIFISLITLPHTFLVDRIYR